MSDGALGDRPTLLDAGKWIEGAVSHEAPEFIDAIRNLADSLRTFIASVHSLSEPPHGLSSAVSQATNDLVDVLTDAARGRGRPSLMSARSLFELLVTTLDLINDSELETRYVDHKWVIAHMEGSLTIEAEHLARKSRAADLHRRKKLLRESESDFRRVLQEYGTEFARHWTPSNLRTRASKHGLDDDYEFYRLASSVLHGSSGGTIGIARTYGEEVVHRTGPALSLCPVALLMALRHYDRLVRAVKKRGIVGIGEVRRGLRKVLNVWPRYRKVMLRIDRTVCPEMAPQ
jgi:hypothetical protein